MSQPLRFKPVNPAHEMIYSTDGGWVSWEDYARLKAAFDLLDESIKLGPSTMPVSRGYYFWKESEQYFLKEENARLKAEVERLEAVAPKGLFDFSVEHLTRLFNDGRIAEVSYEGERSQWYCADAYARCVRAEIEANRLKAQVERLTKAGDAMIEEWWLQLSCPQRMKASWMKEQAIADWLAAKEGKSNA